MWSKEDLERRDAVKRNEKNAATRAGKVELTGREKPYQLSIVRGSTRRNLDYLQRKGLSEVRVISQGNIGFVLPPAGGGGGKGEK
jgi:hypothetical protein